jgi:hypothetical protein
LPRASLSPLGSQHGLSMRVPGLLTQYSELPKCKNTTCQAHLRLKPRNLMPYTGKTSDVCHSLYGTDQALSLLTCSVLVRAC